MFASNFTFKKIGQNIHIHYNTSQEFAPSHNQDIQIFCIGNLWDPLFPHTLHAHHAKEEKWGSQN